MEKLVKLQKELKAPKNQKNKFGGYNYRNCEDILEQLNCRRRGKNGQCSRPTGGTHQLCNDKTARRAAIFQRELCEGVLIGLKNYTTRHGRMKNN